MEIKFTNEPPVSRLDEIIEFISGPRLWISQDDYPDFSEWAERVHREIRHDTKRVMVAISQQEIIGVMVYQRHKTMSDRLELKNLTVRPEARGRYIASFLLRNTEIEGSAEFGSRSVVCDAKAHNLPIRLFLLKQGYLVARRENLYDLNTGDDLLYQKPLLIVPTSLGSCDLI